MLKAMSVQTNNLLHSHMTPLNAKIDLIDSKVVQSETEIKTVNTKLIALEGRLNVLEQGRSGGGTGSAAGGDPYGSVGSAASDVNIPPVFRLPVTKRKLICVGGFAYGEGAVLQAELSSTLEAVGFSVANGKITRVFAVGTYTERCKIEFPSSEHMWTFLKTMKGKKLPSEHAAADRFPHYTKAGSRNLWHSIDKYPEEIACAARCKHARKVIIAALKVYDPNLSDEDCEKAVDSTRDMGSVVLLRKYIEKMGNQAPLRLYMRAFPTTC